VRKFSVKRRERGVAREPQRDDFLLARRLAKAVKTELKDFVVAVVLFGSCAKDRVTQMSDIDILIVVDDVRHIVNDQVTEHYRAVVASQAGKISARFHLNTLKLSNFWEYCREGDPVVVNMLRDGVPLEDTGLFAASQLLLDQGRVRPSREAIWTYYTRSGTNVRSAESHVLAACSDLYWAAMDASHAALMAIGATPASPEHVPEALERELVKRGLLAKRLPGVLQELYLLHKAITHREVRTVTGEQFDVHMKDALALIEALRSIVERTPPNR
jgi:predicted nucleotidyltransferase